MGRDYRVTGRDVTLRPGELTKGRMKNMKEVLMRTFPRRSPLEEEKMIAFVKAGVDRPFEL